jgi:hypothetical protein
LPKVAVERGFGNVIAKINDNTEALRPLLGEATDMSWPEFVGDIVIGPTRL